MLTVRPALFFFLALQNRTSEHPPFTEELLEKLMVAKKN
jgi:hypothetical protein